MHALERFSLSKRASHLCLAEQLHEAQERGWKPTAAAPQTPRIKLVSAYTVARVTAACAFSSVVPFLLRCRKGCAQRSEDPDDVATDAAATTNRSGGRCFSAPLPKTRESMMANAT